LRISSRQGVIGREPFDPFPAKRSGCPSWRACRRRSSLVRLRRAFSAGSELQRMIDGAPSRTEHDPYLDGATPSRKRRRRRSPVEPDHERRPDRDDRPTRRWTRVAGGRRGLSSGTRVVRNQPACEAAPRRPQTSRARRQRSTRRLGGRAELDRLPDAAADVPSEPSRRECAHPIDDRWTYGLANRRLPGIGPSATAHRHRREQLFLTYDDVAQRTPVRAATTSASTSISTATSTFTSESRTLGFCSRPSRVRQRGHPERRLLLHAWPFAGRDFSGQRLPAGRLRVTFFANAVTRNVALHVAPGNSARVRLRSRSGRRRRVCLELEQRRSPERQRGGCSDLDGSRHG